jgi:FHA domain
MNSNILTPIGGCALAETKPRDRRLVKGVSSKKVVFHGQNARTFLIHSRLSAQTAAPPVSCCEFSSAMAEERRAYAKIQLLGPGGVMFYLTQFRATFGRGPGVDFKVSDDLAISRRHARIEYSAEAQAFELIVLGKNGAFVNGAFLQSTDHPHLLASQTEITFGKTNPVTMIFLLPCAMHTSISQKPHAKRPRSLLMMIGQVILGSNQGRLSADGILTELRRQHPAYAKSIGEHAVLVSSIRHALITNHHLFAVHPAQDLEVDIHDADVELWANSTNRGHVPDSFKKKALVPVPAAQFSVLKDHVVRFFPAD